MLKNITLSADKLLIEKARQQALKEHTTLNSMFREWLNNYVQKENRAKNYKSLMKELSYANPGKKFSRDELNER